MTGTQTVGPVSATGSDTGPGTGPADQRRLSGNLGTVAIIAMVLAAAAPLGVIGGPVPLAIATGNGPGFPATYVVATLVLVLFAVGFTAMTPHVRRAGAFFSYVQRGLGGRPAIGVAFVAVLTYAAMETAVYGLLGPQLNALSTQFGGPSLPWWLWAFAGFLVVAYLGHRNIELSSRVLGVLLLAEIAVILVLDAAIIGTGGEEGLSGGITDPSAVLSGAPGIGLLFAIVSYLGFEATAIFRDEARDPDRTIPRATYGALVVIGVFYTLSSWALVSAWGDRGAVTAATDAPDTMLVTTAERYIGAASADIIQVLFVTSLFACILSFHNVVSRYLFALSVQGHLPRPLGEAHRSHGSPHRASLVLSVVIAVIIVAAVVAGLDPAGEFYTWLAGITTVGVLVLMVATSLAVLNFFGRDARGYSRWRVTVAPAAGLVGLGAFLALVLGNLSSLVGGSGALATAIVLVLAGTFAAGWWVGGRREVNHVPGHLTA